MTISNQNINPDMSVEELVDEFPEAVRILREEGVVCIMCGEPVWGTLRDAIERKGIKDVDRIVEKLKKSLS